MARTTVFTTRTQDPPGRSGGVFSLNEEQERAFRLVANHSTSPYNDQLKMYIAGMGGTGKSQVLKALIKFFQLRKEEHRIIIVAPLDQLPLC